MKLNKNIKIFINYFLGPLLFVWLSLVIYRQIRQQPNLALSWQHIRDSFNSAAAVKLFIVLALMFVNWGIESLKWKLCIDRVQYLSFGKAFKAILSGVSFSVSTPNRMGEYVGRVLYMDEGNRLRTISLTIVGSISQLIITLFMGVIGLFFLMPKIYSNELVSVLWVKVLLFGVLLVLGVLTIIYFRLSWLVKWFDRLPSIKRYAYLVNAVEEVNATLLLQLLSLSAIRFFVFTIQYYLLFRLFGVEISLWQCFCAVSVIFLVMAVIPTITLVEVVQRSTVALKIVGLFSSNDLGVGLTTITIWFINLVIPALIGSLLILSIKIFRSRNEVV